jgi:hypothetical protein
MAEAEAEAERRIEACKRVGQRMLRNTGVTTKALALLKCAAGASPPDRNPDNLEAALAARNTF